MLNSLAGARGGRNFGGGRGGEGWGLGGGAELLEVAFQSVIYLWRGGKGRTD